MDAVFAGAKWKKATKSAIGNCVEVAFAAEGNWVGVRDSKNPDGPILKLRPIEWRGFLADIRAEKLSA